MTLKKLQLVPLAAESLGVRSMCTYVESPNLSVILDAGVSLCPKRFQLPPHPQEYDAIRNARLRIAEYAKKADVVTISHYHLDHYTPSYEDWSCHWTALRETAKQIYENKLVLAKSYRSHVNSGQRRRGWFFKKAGGKHAKQLVFGDNQTFFFGETKLWFSEPVFHGAENSPLGWVLMTRIEYGQEKVIFASDVQGPMSDSTLQMLIEESPNLVIVGGPPTYLAGFQVSEAAVNRGLRNLEALAKHVPVIILEHHILRDIKWRESAANILSSAERTGNIVVTAAEFLGLENKLLEANRKELFEEDPPAPDFKRWLLLPEPKRTKTKPPI